MRDQMNRLIGKMLDGQIFLGEAIAEFEKLYIEQALERNSAHLSKTADTLGIHRNTLTKRIASYNGSMSNKKSVRAAKKPKLSAKRNGR